MRSLRPQFTATVPQNLRFPQNFAKFEVFSLKWREMMKKLPVLTENWPNYGKMRPTRRAGILLLLLLLSREGPIAELRISAITELSTNNGTHLS